MRNALKARNIILSLTLALILVLSSAVVVSACEISLSSLGTSGEEVTIEVHIYLDHRKCDVPIADTIVKLDNLTLVEQTPWQMIATRTYTAEITLQKPAQGEGTLTIIRECVKGGGSAAVTVSPDGTVKGASPPAVSSSGGSSSSGTSSSGTSSVSLSNGLGAVPKRRRVPSSEKEGEALLGTHQPSGIPGVPSVATAWASPPPRTAW